MKPSRTSWLRASCRWTSYSRCAIQIAEALAAAHRVGLVHGDLNPGNIIVTKSGTKLLNFARPKTPRELAAAPVTDVRTDEPLADCPQVVGSIHYLAPEQLEGQDGDARSDLFAFGAILYEMLSRNPSV